MCVCVDCKHVHKLYGTLNNATCAYHCSPSWLSQEESLTAATEEDFLCGFYSDK